MLRLVSLPVVQIWTSFLCLVSAGAPVAAQTVFSAVVFNQGQPVNGLFRAENGVVTAIPTGLPTNNFSALSPDGRFITMASRNPLQPNNLATDLFIFDRLTKQRRTLIDYPVERHRS
jgi:hypothetical protein